MGLDSAIEKLGKYVKRLEEGKAKKIKPSHVEKIIRKLESKDKSLREEIAETEKPEKKQRLEKKLQTVQDQKNRADWLLQEITAS